MNNQTFQERINDTNKVQLSTDFIHKIKVTAANSNFTIDEIWQKWNVYATQCRNADQSALFSEFCEWNNLPVIN